MEQWEGIPLGGHAFDGSESQHPSIRNGNFNSATENYLLGESNPRIIQ